MHDTEIDAFHRIRKASMYSRTSMRQVAEAILLTSIALTPLCLCMVPSEIYPSHLAR